MPTTEIDDAFDDLRPPKKRRLGSNSKEKAALGIFGSDSDDDGPNLQWKKKTLRNRGVAFVSVSAETGHGGDESDQDDGRTTHDILGKLEDIDGDENVEEDVEEDTGEDDDHLGPGIGLGFGPTSFKGSRVGVTDAAEAASTSDPKPHHPGRSVPGNAFVPSSAREPILREALATQQPPQNKSQPSTFSSKGKMNAKGFGARMMAKMGYEEGKGLGKERQGRNIIIEANLRPQGVGLGAVKEKSEQERREEKRQARLRGETVVDSDEEDKRSKKARQKPRGGTSGRGTSTPRRQKPRYLTAAELQASAPGLHIPDAFTPILDMTRPGSQLITSTSGLMTPESGVRESPENVEARRLAQRVQADLMAFSDEWSNLQEQSAAMDVELREMESEVQDAQSDYERLQGLLDITMQKLVVASDLDEIVSCLEEMTAEPFGAASVDMAELAVAAIHPVLEEAEWEPLRQPVKFVSELSRISGLLMVSKKADRAIDKIYTSDNKTRGVYRQHVEATTPYESMMLKIWFRKVNRASSHWDPWAPEAMLDLVESWKELLPPFIWQQVMMLVARRLKEVVDSWEPRRKRQDQSLPHIWFFPWLPHLPAYHLDPKGTGLVSDMKRKFRALIDVWEFERGPIPKFKQWETVFGEQWRSMTMSHLLPSMGRYLQSNFRVNPADQEPYLPILTHVLRWGRVLSSKHALDEVVKQHVFPMWHSKLQEWMALPDVDLQEVADWYEWWRGTLFKDLTGAGVREELDKGMRFLNKV